MVAIDSNSFILPFYRTRALVNAMEYVITIQT